MLPFVTCSHQSQTDEYLEYFNSKGSNFKFVNENPGVKDNKYGNFSGKSYMNALLEDKAGLDPEVDWKILRKYMSKLNK